jgi:hypothetical protein
MSLGRADRVGDPCSTDFQNTRPAGVCMTVTSCAAPASYPPPVLHPPPRPSSQCPLVRKLLEVSSPSFNPLPTSQRDPETLLNYCTGILCSRSMWFSGDSPMQARMMFTRQARCANSAFTTVRAKTHSHMHAHRQTHTHTHTHTHNTTHRCTDTHKDTQRRTDTTPCT